MFVFFVSLWSAVSYSPLSSITKTIMGFFFLCSTGSVVEVLGELWTYSGDQQRGPWSWGLLLFDDASADLDGPDHCGFSYGSFSDLSGGNFNELQGKLNFRAVRMRMSSLKKQFIIFGNVDGFWPHLCYQYIKYLTLHRSRSLPVSLLDSYCWLVFGLTLTITKIQFGNQQGEQAKAERSVNAFLAHEVRNPLSVALSAIQSMQSSVSVGNARNTERGRNERY
jgi:hypothetical protein